MNAVELFARLEKNIGAKVEIANKFGLHKGKYASNIAETKGNLVGFAQPILRGQWVPMTRVELTVIIEMDGCILEIDVRSKNSTVKGQVSILWAELTDNIRKVQRRNFVRVPCILGAKCCPLNITNKETDKDNIGEWFDITIVDTSLGGVAASPKETSDSHLFVKEKHYLIAVNFGNGIVFLKTTMRNIFPNEEGISVGAFSFDDVSSSQERQLGEFVRKQEFASK